MELNKKVKLTGVPSSDKALVGKVIGTSAKGKLIAVEFDDGTIQVDIREEEVRILS